jgi:hypothetical protein
MSEKTITTTLSTSAISYLISRLDSLADGKPQMMTYALEMKTIQADIRIALIMALACAAKLEGA